MQMFILPFLLALSSECVLADERAMDEAEVEMTEQCISSEASVQLLQSQLVLDALASPQAEGPRNDHRSKPFAAVQKAQQTRSVVVDVVEDQATALSPCQKALNGTTPSSVGPGANHDKVPGTIGDDTLRALIRLLENAAELEVNATTVDGNSIPAEEVLRDIEGIQQAGGNVSGVVTSIDHAAIIRAINEVETHETVGSMVARGEEVTSEMLQQIDGAEGDLETVRHQDPGSTVVGDTIIVNSNGAMLLQKQGPVTVWPGGSVPYCFEPSLNEDVRAIFLEVIGSISSLVPCITFHEVAHVHGALGDAAEALECDAPKAIFLQSHPTLGCNAYVGVTYMAVTRINIEPGGTCVTHGVMEHEVGHALGMYHEHQRPDRDDYVQVNETNAKDPGQYEIIPSADTEVPYDHLSLMHYRGSNEKNAIDASFPLIESIDASKQALMGQRAAFTQLDVEQLGSMYDCSSVADLCSTYGASSCSSSSPCVCPANQIKVSANINGEACEVCAQECLLWPEATSYEACQCPSTLVKKASEGKVNDQPATIYSCAAPEQLQCPSGFCTTDSSCTCPPELIKKEKSSGCFSCEAVELCPGGTSGTTDETCVCGAEEIKKSFIVDGVAYYGCRPEVEECPTSGCTSDDACVCTGGKLKRTLTAVGGGDCYGCRDPCPATPGSCSSDFSCGCPDGQQRTLIFLPSGAGCVACRSAPVTQYGCACKQSWSLNGYGSEDYCQPVGSGSICEPADPSCEPTGLWYGWCGLDW